MNGAALGWVFWLQFWRLWLFGDRAPLPVPAPVADPPERSGVVDLARWRRDHERGAA